MKKIILFLGCTLLSFSMSAQIQTPAPSPSAKLQQKVGLTDVTIEYSRPSKKGRTVFGDLVPYGKVWRTGANAKTKITFSDDVKVGGKELKAGTYAILTKPDAQKWEVIFYTDTEGGAPAELDQSKVAASVSAEVFPIPFDVETFTIDLNNLTNNGANLEFIWEKVYVAVPIEVPTQTKAMESINRVMAGPGPYDYFQAASYYFQEDKDINKAKEWIDKSIENIGEEKPFWMLRQQALIYEKAGDRKGAIKVAKASLAAAEKEGNADYVKMNQDSLKEWGAK